MHFNKYIWDDLNVEHLARHGVIPQEAEEACFNEPFIMKFKKDRYVIYGRSDTGRYLFIIAVPKFKGTIKIITARDMTKTEYRLYNKKRS